MRLTKLLAVAVLGLFVLPVQAELYGLGNGKTANLDNLADLSVEAGANLGSTLFGARLNYKIGPNILLYGDVGRIDNLGFDGFVFGLGATYQLRDLELLDNTDFAVRASFHGGTLEGDFFGIRIDGLERDASEIAVNAVISGDQLASTNFAWYGHLGIHVLDLGTQAGFGAGVVGDTSFGQWYAGIERAGDTFLTVGLRYNIR